MWCGLLWCCCASVSIHLYFCLSTFLYINLNTYQSIFRTIYLSIFCISNYLSFSLHIYFLSIFLSLLGILVCQRLMITWKDIKLGIFQPWRPNLKTRSSWWSMEQQVCFFVTFDNCVLRVALLIVAFW